jgi:sec-independent protein translocase protein TatC
MHTEFKKFTLAQHLQELKRRTIYCLVSFVVCFIFSYCFSSNIFEILAAPLVKISSSHRMIYTNLPEVFFTYLQLALYMALILSAPFILCNLYIFLAPGLYKKERRILLPYLFASVLLFILGAVFAYQFMPIAWEFFLSFETSTTIPIKFEAKVSEYLAFIMQLIIAFGLSFQMPILLCVLTEVGIITPDFLKKGRKFAIVIIFIIAAIFTPPDVISQIALAIPLLILYEISILACAKIYHKRKNKNA